MIKADGNKIAVTMVLTRDLNDFAERRAYYGALSRIHWA